MQRGSESFLPPILAFYYFHVWSIPFYNYLFLPPHWPHLHAEHLPHHLHIHHINPMQGFGIYFFAALYFSSSMLTYLVIRALTLLNSYLTSWGHSSLHGSVQRVWHNFLLVFPCGEIEVWRLNGPFSMPHYASLGPETQIITHSCDLFRVQMA